MLQCLSVMGLLIHIERRRINIARNGTSLSNLYRPQTLDEVCGQSSIVKILKRQIETKSYKHSYILVQVKQPLVEYWQKQ